MVYLQLANIVTIVLAITAAVILFKIGKRLASLLIWLVGLYLVYFFIVTYGNPDLLVRGGVRIAELLHEVYAFLRDLYRSVM